MTSTKARSAEWKAVASLVLGVPSIPLLGLGAPAAVILALSAVVDALHTSSTAARRLSAVALGVALAALLAAGLLLSAFIGVRNCAGTGTQSGPCRFKDLPTLGGWLVINGLVGLLGIGLANLGARRGGLSA